jgi:hypothetical protein
MLETESIVLEMELTALEMSEACQDSSCFSIVPFEVVAGREFAPVCCPLLKSC